MQHAIFSCIKSFRTKCTFPRDLSSRTNFVLFCLYIA